MSRNKLIVSVWGAVWGLVAGVYATVTVWNALSEAHSVARVLLSLVTFVVTDTVAGKFSIVLLGLGVVIRTKWRRRPS